MCVCSIGYNSDAEKTRLQNRMAFGQDSVPMVAPTRPTPLVAEDEENVDRFEEGNKSLHPCPHSDRNSSHEITIISHQLFSDHFPAFTQP